MTDKSDTFKLVNAMELAKTARVGMELTYFDVIELMGEFESLKEYITEIERDKEALSGIKDILREHIDIGTLQLSAATARIAELEKDNDEFRQLIRNWSIVLEQDNLFQLWHVEIVRQAMLEINKECEE